MRRLVFDEERWVPANSCYIDTIIVEWTRAQEIPLLDFPFDDAQCYLHIFNIFWYKADGFTHESHIYISYYEIISRIGYSRIEIQT